MGTYDLQRYISFLGEYLQQQNFEAADKTDRATRIQDTFLYLKEAGSKQSSEEDNLEIIKEARARKGLHRTTSSGAPRMDLRRHVFESNKAKSKRSKAQANKRSATKPEDDQAVENKKPEQKQVAKPIAPSKQPAQKPAAKPQAPVKQPVQKADQAKAPAPVQKEKPAKKQVSKLNFPEIKQDLTPEMKRDIIGLPKTAPEEKKGNNVKVLNPKTPAKVKGILNKADKVTIPPPKGMSLKSKKSKKAWVDALEKTASMGELITVAGKPNYSLIMSNYVSSFMENSESINEQEYSNNISLVKKARYQRGN